MQEREFHVEQTKKPKSKYYHRRVIGLKDKLTNSGYLYLAHRGNIENRTTLPIDNWIWPMQ